MTMRWINAVVLLGVTGLLAIGAAHRTPELVMPKSAVPHDAVADLERAVAKHPSDGNAVRFLVQAYLDRDMPGLAVAVLQRSPAAVRTPVEADLAARAYLGAGHATEALALSRQVLTTCDEGGCEATLVAHAARRAALLESMVEMGIEDADKDPEGASLAYRRSTRRVTIAMN
jgi:hypothetical protein